MASVLRARPRSRVGPWRPGGAWRRRTVVLLAVTAVAVALLPARAGGALAAAGARAAADTGGQFEQQVLFDASDDDGYACFRIPAVVRAKSGTLLAFAEGRVDTCGDAGDIDLVLRRSADGGRTWGPLQVVDEGGGDTHGNPAPVVDQRTGRVLLASTYNTGRHDAQSCDVPCDRTPHLQYSDDDGATWSRPRDLSDTLRPPSWNSWYATGPVHGVQLTRGPHDGRLVFCANAESYAGGRVTHNHAALAYSDDGGDSWRLGAVDTWPVQADGTFRQKPSEMTLVERQDGSLYVNGREQDGTDLGHRTAAVSHDGGETFAAPFRAVPDLYTPQVQAAVVRLREQDSDGYNQLLLSAPADPERRRTMMIRSSWDEGRTWDSVDRGTVVSRDWAGYSDMVRVSRDVVGLLYEGGVADAREEIRFARFTEDWLARRREPDPVTPDLAPDARPATVLGDPDRTDGRFGNAMSFDGVDDAVRLPYRDSLPLGTRDFTVSLWFRYTAGSGQQPFLWMGGTGARQPQVWLRGEPASDRVVGHITAVSGAAAPAGVSVAADAAHNDGRWHHAALVRGDGRLTLAVDGGEPVSVPDVPGTVSRTSPFGVHLGQSVDSRTYLSGALDEVRVYGWALSDSELRRAREDGAPAAETGPVVLRLPLDRVLVPASRHR
ncbi:sialidase family protein [Streptomyces sp. B1866]|uniref:sialidase family protein n=1 Tax=Streptomyces sp. B1866 TaxID=3075431 RepID=UPI0028907094|nr:sialidase family protein [Streptomyces sp. B1866]MDT3398732.1 sialidase family protein [Streptomyces sp. B1866]